MSITALWGPNEDDSDASARMETISLIYLFLPIQLTHGGDSLYLPQPPLLSIIYNYSKPTGWNVHFPYTYKTHQRRKHVFALHIWTHPGRLDSDDEIFTKKAPHFICWHKKKRATQIHTHCMDLSNVPSLKYNH